MLNPLEIEALKLSGFIAIVAVSVSVIPGIIIAWIISRKKGLKLFESSAEKELNFLDKFKYEVIMKVDKTSMSKAML